MKTLAVLSIWLALPLAAETPSTQTPPTPDEHDAYVLMVIQDLAAQNVALNSLRYHKASFEDLDAAAQAHAERMKALQELAKEHNACEGADYNIAKKDWVCPEKGKN